MTCIQSYVQSVSCDKIVWQQKVDVTVTRDQFSLTNAILSSLLYIECFRNQPVPVLINSTELSKHSYHTEDILHVSCDTLCRDNRQLTSFGFDDDSMYNTFLKRHLNKIWLKFYRFVCLRPEKMCFMVIWLTLFVSCQS